MNTETRAHSHCAGHRCDCHAAPHRSLVRSSRSMGLAPLLYAVWYVVLRSGVGVPQLHAHNHRKTPEKGCSHMLLHPCVVPCRHGSYAQAQVSLPSSPRRSTHTISPVCEQE